MPDRILIVCPGCSAKLAISDASKLGKKIRCSKCSEVFVAKAAAAGGAKTAKPSKPAPAAKPKKSDDDEFNFDDMDLEDKSESEEEESAEETPAKPSKGKSSSGKKGAATKGKGKGKGKSGGGKMPLIIGGSVAAVLLIGVGLYFLLSGGDAPPEPPAAQPAAPAPAAAAQDFPADRILALKWLPADTELIIHLKVADAWQAPLLQGLLSAPPVQGSIQQMQQLTGLTPTDIESVTIGIRDFQRMQGPAAMMAMGGAPPTDSPGLIVIRSKKKVDPSALSTQIVQSAEMSGVKLADHGGKPYLEAAASQPGGKSLGAWFADANTLIGGPTDELFAAMDRGETVTPRNEFRAIDATPHLVFVVAPKNPQLMSQSAPLPPGASPAVAEMQKAMQESMTAVSLGLNVRGGVDLQTSLVCKDSAGSSKIKAGFDALVAEGKQTLAGKKSTTPPLLFELGELLLNNVQVSDQSQVVKVAMSIPDSAQQKLEQLPGALMGMMLMGGGPFASAGGGNSLTPPGGGAEQTIVKNNLKEVVIAMHTHHDMHKTFPAAYNADSDGKPLLSWRVHTLPLLGAEELYKEFHLTEPWDSPHNMTLVEKIPAVFASPDNPDFTAKGLTRIVVPVGAGFAFEGKDGIPLAAFTDGSSFTLLVLEASATAAVVWTKPEDLTIDLNMPLEHLQGARDEGCLAAFADGSVRHLKDSLNAEVLKALLTRNAGETIPAEALQ